MIDSVPAVHPHTIRRHELADLPVHIGAATDPTLVGRDGRVVRETMRTLVIETESGEESSRIQVEKRGTTFAFTVDAPTGGADGSSTSTVLVDGDRLVARPALRTEMTGESPWR